MSIEAMKQALEALEFEFYDDNIQRKLKAAITALRTAIAECGARASEKMEKQAPVAWHTVHKAVVAAVEACKAASGMHRAIDLVVNATQITHDTLGTDTTPPAAQRQWVGLDSLEVSDLWLDTPFDDCTEETFEAGRAFVEAIEAKLREKNAAQPAPVQEPPPECQTEAEKRAYAFGWWKAMEYARENGVVK